MRRKDYRSNDEFAKDIFFSTKLEGYLWKLYCERILKDYKFESEDYGIDNTGKVVAKSSNRPDYKLKLTIDNKIYELLLEIKFGPNSSKLTFKTNDLKAYIKMNANILLFYNTGPVNLRKPNDHDLSKHFEKIYKNIHYIKYALLSPKILTRFLESYPSQKIYYMGNKPSIIVPSDDYSKFFTGHNL